VYTEGITKITREDITYAEQLGYRIKHLAMARRTPAGIQLRVHPTLIPYRRLIANVDGVMNAVLVTGDAVGPTLYYGAGAGAEPTAEAVGSAPSPPTRKIAYRILPFKRTPCRTRRYCRWARSKPRTTCACRRRTAPAY